MSAGQSKVAEHQPRSLARIAVRHAHASQRASREVYHLDDPKVLEEHLDLLDAYRLSKEPPAFQSPREKEIHLRRIWAQVFAEAELQDEQLGPYRALHAWRLIREHARLKHMLKSEDTLASGLALHSIVEDPWTVYTELPASTASFPYVEHHARMKLTDCPAPLFPTTAMTIEQRETFCMVLAAVGTAIHFDATELGAAALLSAMTVVEKFPGPLEVMAFEEILIRKAAKWLVGGDAKEGSSVDNARFQLMQNYDLTQNEALGMIRQAKQRIRENYTIDKEEERAYQLARLDDVIVRAQKALNLKQEIQALVQQSRVLGLTRTEPEDAVADFLTAVRKVSSDRPLEIEATARVVSQGETVEDEAA